MTQRFNIIPPYYRKKWNYIIFLLQEEELEWYALTLAEANRKQIKLEEQSVGPYKHIFRKEFIQFLKDNPEVVKSKDQEEESPSFR